MAHWRCCCRACLSCGSSGGNLETLIPSTVTMDATVRYREWDGGGVLIRDCTQHVTQTLYLDSAVCQYDALLHNPSNLTTLYCHDGSGTDGDGAAFVAQVQFQRTTTLNPASPNPNGVVCGWIASIGGGIETWQATGIEDDPDGSPLGTYPGTISNNQSTGGPTESSTRIDVSDIVLS